MKILLTNDDGVDAPGLAALYKALISEHEVKVVAPLINQSGVASGITLYQPLRLDTRPNGFQATNGKPADCVKLALGNMPYEQWPDMVVSGINCGQNLGDDILYSGTVGGAMEGRFCRLPSIAISCVAEENCHYESAAQVALELCRHIEDPNFRQDMVLNVNVPNLPYEALNGFRVTQLGDREISLSNISAVDGRNRPITWLGDCGPIKENGPNTDFIAIADHAVSITPLQHDMTGYNDMAQCQNAFIQQTETEYV